MGAALAGVPVVVWGLWSGLSYLYVITAASLAAPLLCLQRPRHFFRACLTVGLVLIAWGVLGVFFGMFLFWPSAVLLLLAPCANPKRHRAGAWVAAGAGALVMAGVLTGVAACTWYIVISPELAEPHTFRAATEAGWFGGGIGDAQEQHLREWGATAMYGTESDEGSFLMVRFPDDLSPTYRAELKKEIGRLPGVRSVELCSVRACG